MIHTKRYLAAAGDKWYPLAYFANVVGLFDTVDEALDAAQESDIPACRNCSGLVWVAVLDLLRMETVAYGMDDGPDGAWLIVRSAVE